MKQFTNIKIYVVITGILLSLYTYANLTGWKIFGSNTEKWEPTEDKKYHK